VSSLLERVGAARPRLHPLNPPRAGHLPESTIVLGQLVSKVSVRQQGLALGRLARVSARVLDQRRGPVPRRGALPADLERWHRGGEAAVSGGCLGRLGGARGEGQPLPALPSARLLVPHQLRQERLHRHPQTRGADAYPRVPPSRSTSLGLSNQMRSPARRSRASILCTHHGLAIPVNSTRIYPLDSDSLEWLARVSARVLH
jgi:hypothetical protein